MVDDNYLVLSTSLCCPHVAGFHLRENAVGNYNYSKDRSFLKGNEENPALVLSNVHNRTSARAGPMFGSKGPSMNTSSLVPFTSPLLPPLYIYHFPCINSYSHIQYLHPLTFA
jgi:hypothetical protein